MAKTNAERQRDYRERAAFSNGLDVSRLNLFIPSLSKHMLKGLAEEMDVSMSDALSIMIEAAFYEYQDKENPMPGTQPQTTQLDKRLAHHRKEHPKK